MSGSLETSAGLLWIGSRTASWLSRADCHVYNVRVSVFAAPPAARRTLCWRTFSLTDETWRYAYVQVHENIGQMRLVLLEIDGASLAFRPCEDP